MDGYYALEILWPWVLSIPDQRAGRPVPGISYTPPGLGLPRLVFDSRPASSPGRRARQADQAARCGAHIRVRQVCSMLIIASPVVSESGGFGQDDFCAIIPNRGQRESTLDKAVTPLTACWDSGWTRKDLLLNFKIATNFSKQFSLFPLSDQDLIPGFGRRIRSG